MTTQGPIVTLKPKLALSEATTRAKERQQALNEATDALNVVLGRAEASIAELRLGVSASVSFRDGECWLKFGRYGDKWRLLVGGEDDWGPLVNESRETRLEAVNLLPSLVEKLCSTVDAEIQRVEQQTRSVEALIVGMETTK